MHAVAADGALDLLLGVGGAPEGLLEAAIVRAHDGVMHAGFAPQSEREASRLLAAGIDLERRFDLDALCGAPAFVAIAPVTACALAVASVPLIAIEPARRPANSRPWPGRAVECTSLRTAEVSRPIGRIPVPPVPRVHRVET